MSPAEDLHVVEPAAPPQVQRHPVNLMQALQELCDATHNAKAAWGSDRMTRAAEAVLEGAYVNLLVPKPLVPRSR